MSCIRTVRDTLIDMALKGGFVDWDRWGTLCDGLTCTFVTGGLLACAWSDAMQIDILRGSSAPRVWDDSAAGLAIKPWNYRSRP